MGRVPSSSIGPVRLWTETVFERKDTVVLVATESGMDRTYGAITPNLARIIEKDVPTSCPPWAAEGVWP